MPLKVPPDVAKHFISLSNQKLCEAEQIKCIQRDVGDIKWFENYFITALLSMQARDVQL